MQEWNILDSTLTFNTDRDFYNTLSGLCRLDTTRLAWLTHSKSSLRNKGLIKRRNIFSSANFIGLRNFLLFAINSKDLTLITSKLFKKVRDAKYKPEQFAIPQMEKDYIYSVLKGNGTVLISGEPGIGKTEYAYGIARHLGKVLRELNNAPSFFSP